MSSFAIFAARLPLKRLSQRKITAKNAKSSAVGMDFATFAVKKARALGNR